MIRRNLIMKLFSGAYMHRWNDKLRPIDFIELDRLGHKMIIAYFLGRFEEDTEGFSWREIIEGGIFEYLQKVILTDIKSPLLYRIREDADIYQRLNQFVYNELRPYFASLDHDFGDRFQNFFLENDNTINKRILNAASTLASQWEFEIIYHADPHGHDNENIRNCFIEKLVPYRDLKGMRQLREHSHYRDFINMCGELRYQSRWADLHRIPKTSVAGHCALVSIFSYIFSLQMKASPKRLYNNFFTGLFHDLPELLTMDIIKPIKKSIEGLNALIVQYEREQMSQLVHPLVPPSMLADIRFFTEDECTTVIDLNGQRTVTTSDTINEKYNEDRFNPRDGELIKAADELCAFIEATEAIDNGCANERFQRARWGIQDKYESIGAMGGIDFRELYSDF